MRGEEGDSGEGREGEDSEDRAPPEMLQNLAGSLDCFKVCRCPTKKTGEINIFH